MRGGGLTALRETKRCWWEGVLVVLQDLDLGAGGKWALHTISTCVERGHEWGSVMAVMNVCTVSIRSMLASEKVEIVEVETRQKWMSQ